MVDKTFYNTSLAQTFSPCGYFLFTGNTYGQIAVFNLKKNVVSPNGEMSTHPTHKIKCPSEICCLASSPEFLIGGSVGEILGWHWNSVKLPSTENANPAWTIQIPISRDSCQKSDVNSIAIIKEDEGEMNHFTTLIVGCGDNMLYMFSLEDGKLLRTFQGHDNYVHSISNLGSSIASASEDGSVRLWDTRQNSATTVIRPFQNEKIARPNLGKWIGDVDLSDQWMICGGGPRLSMWHTRTMSVGTVFTSIQDKGIHVTKFIDDKILGAGASRYVSILSYKDKIHAEIETSQITVYSALHQIEPIKVLSIAGSSSKVDLCTNFNYRDHILSLA